MRVLGPFHFNLIRQAFVTMLLAGIVLLMGSAPAPGWPATLILAASGVIGILIGDTFNFAAVGRLGPRRAGAVFALNAPMAAIMGWVLLGEALPWRGSAALAVAGLALIFAR